ncbi:amino acid permease-domain-containing protein [Boeremia exigua]|uniref:amino acid permease-domain-containing protein n=1 Tax=Boeremia exigua TaxID=749465 RepID=UPI001E8E7069|nr:amino acid permease-domain-containing protein [Boeremia exigua]KAH6643500.1 amino acid permease-domain-containing protein [Boeremia exigua]
MDCDNTKTEPKLAASDQNLSLVHSTPQPGIVTDNADNLQRRLGNRQIQLLAIGGAIGTALFVSIGNGLAAGGSGSLLIAYSLWCIVVAAINNSISEMVVLQPVAGGFVRIAGHWFDDALGFMVGWNFFFFEVLAIPFEIAAVNLVVTYWTDKIPVAAICAICIILYRYAEFWLSGGKVILIFIVLSFTFVTMVGGNPQKDAYGFRYWNNPGAFADNPARSSTGSLGRFEGFLSCLWSAAFTIVGPEYISIAAAETKRPRVYVKGAFKTVYWRFGAFFILGSLCVGIVVPWNDPQLQGVFLGTSGGGGTVTASPYVIAMSNMGIGVLPHIVSALLITSIFSAGNTYVYCATRTLYGMALEGRAPRMFSKTTTSGIPVYSFLAVICFGFLSFLQVNQGSAKVISWLISLITGCGMIDYFTMCITFINYHKACKAQGLDRATLPYYGWLQPGCAYLGAISTFLVALFYGYSVFKPFSVEGFFQNYTMQLVAPILYLGWKIIKRTKKIKPDELDLVWERPMIDIYEESFVSPPNGFCECLTMETNTCLRPANHPLLPTEGLSDLMRTEFYSGPQRTRPAG